MNFEGRCFVFEQEAIFFFHSKREISSKKPFFSSCLHESHFKAFKWFVARNSTLLSWKESRTGCFVVSAVTLLVNELFMQKNCRGVCRNKSKNIILLFESFLHS